MPVRRSRTREPARHDLPAGLLHDTVGVDEPEHPLHAHYRAIHRQLRALGTVPGMLTVEDVHRMAAQLLLECWLVGMERIDRLAVDAQERLVACQEGGPGEGGRLSVTLEVMQALSYSVAESTRALEEAMAAWPLTAAQRRALHVAGPGAGSGSGPGVVA